MIAFPIQENDVGVKDVHRVGKFNMAYDYMTMGEVAEIFWKMTFVPFRVEHIFYKNSFEFLGVSPLFEEREEGDSVPEYLIKASKDEYGNITVTAVRKW